jgi:hypothetical protein
MTESVLALSSITRHYGAFLTPKQVVVGVGVVVGR